MTTNVDAFWDRYDRELISSTVAAFDRHAADVRRRGEKLLVSNPGAGRILLGTARCLDECAAGVATLLADPSASAPTPVLIEAERIPPSPASSSGTIPL